MGKPDFDAKGYGSAEEAAEALILKAAEPGLSKANQRYRIYARELGTMMARSLETHDADDIMSYFMAVANTFGIACGNIIINTDVKAEPFVIAAKKMVAAKIDKHVKTIVAAAAKMRGETNG